MTEKLKVAAVQFEPRMFAKEANVAALSMLIAEAAGAGARLITTPEMGVTGYCWRDREEVAPFVEPVPGPTTDHFHALARRHDCYLVIGLAEVDPDTGLYYNSAVMIGPEGIVGHHRKSHPYISEPRWSAPGDTGHQVFDTPIGRIALLICMDIHFIETARLVAVEGVDVICHISNWLAERTPAPYWISRAVENNCFLIESNRWGLERGVQFSGGSCVIGRDGAVLASVDSGDGIAYADLDIAHRDHRHGASRGTKAPSLAGPMNRRRPEMYRSLIGNPFVWNPLDFFSLYGVSALPPGKQSRVAAMQFLPTADAQHNIEQVEQMVADAVRETRAELLVFPELALTGFDGTRPISQTLPGPASDALVRLAITHRTYLVAGLAEQDGDARYNTTVLAGPEGLIGSYRKIHLDDADLTWARAGDEWKFFDTRIGRIGILAGYDALFPESGRILALAGCDVIVCGAALRGSFVHGHAGTAIRQRYPIPTAADPLHWHHFRVRSGENNVYFIFSNVCDPDNGFIGQSGVFGPDTFSFPRDEAVVASARGRAVLDIDTRNLDSPYPTNIVRRKDHLMMRLPHHYVPLIRQKR